MYKKRFLKSGAVKVDFVLSEDVAAGADTAFLVGDFNDWDETATPMQRLKNGSFKVTVNLEPDRKYQFRYLVDGKHWHNDWHAEEYVPNPFSGDNSVISTYRTNGDN